MNNTLNIAMFGHKRIPSREGGIEVVVEELSTRMVKCGHKVCCYNRKGQHVSGAEFKCETKDDYKGITIKNVFTIDKKGLAAVTSSFFASILSAIGKYNVVHIHAEGPAAFCWLPKLFGKKVIVTVHGLDHQRAKWGKFASAYIMLGEKNAVKFADDIIVLSQSVQQYFMDTYGRETIFIPNGVNRMKTIEASLIKDEFGIEKDDYILYLGRLVPEKGIRYLIEAYKNINTDKKLVIAGGSSDTDIFKYE
ncbi:MAG: glycosyltransferase family 4 protein, partial [Oscillospiraceae bacterium]|nr:glycosyltransferase family 4 protein [Oscillospiraceae bacterium]